MPDVKNCVNMSTQNIIFMSFVWEYNWGTTIFLYPWHCNFSQTPMSKYVTYNSVYIQQRLYTSISVLGLWEAEKFFGNSINAKSYVYWYFITSNWKYQIILIYPDIPCKRGYRGGVYKNHPPCLSLQLSVSPYFL